MPARIRVFLQDKMRALGKPAYLYLPVTPDTPGVIKCSCVDNATTQADQPCYSCYGVHYAPGYLRFGSETLYWASIEPGWTLTNCALDLEIRPNRILMDAGATAAIIETTDKSVSVAAGLIPTWDYDQNSFLRAPGNTVTTEYSKDSGATWIPIDQINNAVNAPKNTDSVRLRITLGRVQATDKSPAFEISRLRRAQTEYLPKQLMRRPDYQAGQILLLRTWVIEQMQLQPALARQTQHLQDRGWTLPLDFFSTALTADTPPAKINNRQAGPHPFYESHFGVEKGDRYAMTSLSYNEQLGLFTHQSWADRLTQPGESYGLVF